MKNQPGIQSFFKPKQSNTIPHSPVPSSSPSSFHTAPTSQTPSPLSCLSGSHNALDTFICEPSHENTNPSALGPSWKASSSVDSRETLRICIQLTFPSQEYSSSLSPPPSTLEPSPAISSSALQPKISPVQPSASSELEVKGSDDEDSDSDGSLADLAELLQSNHSSGNRPRTPHAPSSPVPLRSKARGSANIHTSPLTVLPKYKFDLKSLADHVCVLSSHSLSQDISFKRSRTRPISFTIAGSHTLLHMRYRRRQSKILTASIPGLYVLILAFG
jgi:hypothetical protein